MTLASGCLLTGTVPCGSPRSPARPAQPSPRTLQANPWAEGLANEPQIVVVEVKTRFTPSTVKKTAKVVTDNDGKQLFVLDLHCVEDRLRWRKLVHTRGNRAQIMMLGAATGQVGCACAVTVL